MNIHELNEEIMKSEKAVLDNNLELAKLEKQLSLRRLTVNDSFDTTNKEYSNQQKRDVFIDVDSQVIDLTKQIKDLRFKVAVLDIECRHKLRNFEILLKSNLGE